MSATLEQLTQAMEQGRPRLLRLAQRRSPSREDAEDAVQEAFMNAFRHLDQFDGRAQLSSWLTRIVLNAATDRMRRHLAHATVAILETNPAGAGGEAAAATPTLPALLDPGPSPEAQSASNERMAGLLRLMGELPAAWRRALHLRAIEGLSTREAAQRLGVAEGTVKSHLFRAHRQLRRQTGLAAGV